MRNQGYVYIEFFKKFVLTSEKNLKIAYCVCMRACVYVINDINCLNEERIFSYLPFSDLFVFNYEFLRVVFAGS